VLPAKFQSYFKDCFTDPKQPEPAREVYFTWYHAFITVALPEKVHPPTSEFEEFIDCLEQWESYGFDANVTCAPELGLTDGDLEKWGQAGLGPVWMFWDDLAARSSPDPS
jgi:hypothetical protein